jgi:HTH-type transcriptional regulator / antitoxin HigA
MEALKYTIIKNEKQYNAYCDILEGLVVQNNPSFSDEIELLTLLIEKWDGEHTVFNDLDPVEIIRYLMQENNLRAKNLAEIMGLSKGTISKILNYQKGLSKETIRKLSETFRISQDAFNRPYKLKNEINRHFRNASLVNTRKKIDKRIAV